jgi:biopolymer transport protein TolR
MAMTMQAGRRAKAEMNVTPLIDVLLVLLIIFMVPAAVPQTPETPPRAEPDERPVVLMVAGDGSLSLNHEKLTRREDLPERLRKVFQYRSDRVLFVDAAAEAEFELVARVMDEAKLVVRVGLMPLRR